MKYRLKINEIAIQLLKITKSHTIKRKERNRKNSLMK